MGCFWSKDDGIAKCAHCGRRAVNNLVIRDHTCEVCMVLEKRSQELLCAPHKPRFGEYRCSCGRYWNSRLSWVNCYQICKKCRGKVLPLKQRELLPSDMTNEKGQEHPKEMCQMCQQLGKYCGNFRQGLGRKTISAGQNRKHF